MSKDIIENMDKQFLKMKQEIQDSYYEFRANMMSELLRVENSKKDSKPKKKEESLIKKKRNQKDFLEAIEELTNAPVLVKKDHLNKMLSLLDIKDGSSSKDLIEFIAESNKSGDEEELEFIEENVYLVMSHEEGVKLENWEFTIIPFKSAAILVLANEMFDIFSGGKINIEDLVNENPIKGFLFQKTLDDFGLDSSNNNPLGLKEVRLNDIIDQYENIKDKVAVSF